MNIINKLKKSLLFWVLFFEVILIIFLFCVGFRVTYAPFLDTSWEAVGSVGQWAGALVGLLIPIAAVYIQSSLDKNKRDIGESNVTLYNELLDFKEKYEKKLEVLTKLVNEDGDIILDGGDAGGEPKVGQNREKLKLEALKFINISMIAKTENVAKYLGINNETAYDILIELRQHDNSISSGGQLSKDNISNIVWIKK